ncbi:MAG: cobalamin-dependent protein [Actinomycetota bacterium]|nr:cobalamin-dependent protein [Actinomycetota bacterium]
MKVLLISENRVEENLVPYPLGISYIAAAVRARGHEVMGLDLMFGENPEEAVSAAIRDFEPDLVGVSIRNIDNQEMYSSVFFLPQAKKIIQLARSQTKVPVVAGGAGFSIFPAECLEYLGLELGVVGEGEGVFADLLDCLERGEDPAEVPGVCAFREGKAIINGKGHPLDFESVPFPDRESFDVSPYDFTPGKIPNFVANLQARRGCYMHCIYCTNPTIEGSEVRFREPSSVVDELALLREKGIRTVHFVDSLFNLPGEYTERLCREMVTRDLGMDWLCSYSPLNPDGRLLELMRKAGCFAISVGNESGSDAMLLSLRKDFAKDHIEKTILGAKAAGLKVNCFLLLGGPGESKESVFESVEFLTRLEPDSVRITVGLRIYPGCELADIAIARGMISRGQNLLTPTFYLEPEVESWLYDFMVGVVKEKSGWYL